MESLVDVVTTVFQATVAGAVVFTAGYANNEERATAIQKAASPLSRRIFLPCLVFLTLAGSTYLTWFRILQIVWPVLVVNITSHIASVLFGLLVNRFSSAPAWLLDNVLYNNVSSYPLLIVQVLGFISSGDAGLNHLVWHTMDSTSDIVSHAVLYIVINLLVVEIARFVLVLIIPRPTPKPQPPADDESEVEPIDAEEATERTPLVRPSDTKPASKISRASLLSPLVIASVFGLVIGLIKPVQRAIFGLSIEQTRGNWAWRSFGSGLQVLALAFVAIDIVGQGAAVKAGEVHRTEERIPPTLGNVLTVVLWRYGVVPAIVIPMIRAFQKIPSTKAYLQDPAFGFVLSLTSFAPPLPGSLMTPYSSSVLFSTFYTSILASVPIAAAVAFAGRGVSYELNFDIVRALKSAGGGGLAGAAAMVVQVLALMPLRTVMNYQYRYGGGFRDSVKHLWGDGGFKRFYAGLGAAIFQGPFSRFGDTAANAGILALLDSLTWPVLVKTVAGSVAAACFRMVLTPIDTLKTTQQTKGGKAGLKLLRDRVKEKGIGCLWYGALATAAATFVGNYPWFGTYNFLQEALPVAHTIVQKLFRQAFIGFVASVVSDTVSNSLRVVKTYRQVHEGDVPYMTAAKEIVASEGLIGLFGRGLRTRILTNGLQGLLFSVLWKLFGDLIANHGK
ncbi:mitochondrial carrier domain-containing protein [Kockovaella imperatae]|uniref:Mitochondrial carrier domain-containing protein n=1 Tax=Kockovaella imperatae TaxID=4999 RepID=A0A1Y1UFW5_9TREE|nr:mitochondrial carrier domain-containing protein [Kockovaella imperatae]ORX36960.1 mitochondrial carrier domain-containing protein [Kockovaella imperatae]